MLTQEQTDKLAEAFLKRRGNRSKYTEEWNIIRDWAFGAVVDYSMLENVLCGQMVIDVKGGEVHFLLSQEGQERAEKLIATDAASQDMIERLKENKPFVKDDFTYGERSLCKRVMTLMYFQKEAIPVPVMAQILSCTEDGVQLAIKQLKDDGMIQQA